MHKFTRFLLGIGLFILVSCSDLSSFCVHPSSIPPFRFSAALPMLPGNAREDDNNREASPQQVNVEIPEQEKPIRINWERLTDVSFKSSFSKELQLDIMFPVFGKEIKKLAGKELIITGYMVPLDVKKNLYAVSRYNFSSCFFCGAAGVESVVSIKFATKTRRFRTDEYCTIQGRMELNDTNVNDFIYIFRDAKAL
jgi:hypothetical protein